jgi:hypothetical protein
MDAHITKFVLQAESLVCTEGQCFLEFLGGSALPQALAHNRQRRQAANYDDKSELPYTR